MVSAVMSGMGTTSGRWVKWSTAVRQHVNRPLGGELARGFKWPLAGGQVSTCCSGLASESDGEAGWLDERW
jgi:hypothetical protein